MATPCVVDDCERPVATLVLCGLHLKRVRRNGTTRKLDQADRFFSHVTERADGCWIYGTVNAGTGYAQVVLKNPATGRYACTTAHRWSYEYFIAEIPSGLVLDHLCRNRACVNPWHLEPVTQEVNVQRGVGSAPICVNGHPYDASNTEVHDRGHRQCRICRQNRERRFLAASVPA